MINVITREHQRKESNLSEPLLLRATCVRVYDAALRPLLPSTEVGQRLGIESVHNFSQQMNTLIGQSANECEKSSSQ